MLDTLLTVWFVLTAASTAYVAYDLLARTSAMGVMKLGWILVLLYTGPVGLALYLASCRKPIGQSHTAFVAPRWKQALGSTIHCLAGDATGIIVAGAITTAIGFTMGVDLVFEYAAGFAFGLLIFQALFRKAMRGGSYLAAIRSTILPEWLSMNALMAGMIPVMVILMSRDVSAMEPTSARFWGVMSLATIVGGVLAYPVNWWLVATGLKHGMGSSRTLGQGGHDPAQNPEVPTASTSARIVVTVITLVMLFVGLALAAGLGDLSMRARPQIGWASLTPTEREIVQLVTQGHTNAAIGERLFISVHTVKKHLSHVYAKVGLDRRAELVAQAAHRDL